jgi:hypothetical protein
MASIKELDRQEEFNNWYYERLQQSVNKIVEKKISRARINTS